MDWSSGIYFRVLVPVEDAAAIAAARAGTPVVPRGRRATCCLLPLATQHGYGVDSRDAGADPDRPAQTDHLIQTLAAVVAETGRRTIALSADQGSPAAAIMSAAREYDAAATAF